MNEKLSLCLIKYDESWKLYDFYGLERMRVGLLLKLNTYPDSVPAWAYKLRDFLKLILAYEG